MITKIILLLVLLGLAQGLFFLERNKETLMDAICSGEKEKVEFILQSELAGIQRERVNIFHLEPKTLSNNIHNISRIVLPNEISLESLKMAMQCRQYLIFQKLSKWYSVNCPATLLCQSTRFEWLDFPKGLLLTQAELLISLLLHNRDLKLASFVLANGHPNFMILANIAIFMMLFLVLLTIRTLQSVLCQVYSFIAHRKLFILKLAIREKLVTVPHVDLRRNILIQAACEGLLDIVIYLREQEKVQVDSWDAFGNTAFMIACEMGHLDIAKYLLEQGAKTEYRDREGRSALHKAAKNGKANIVRFLSTQLEHVLTQRDASGLSACLLAASSGDLETLNCLLAKSQPIFKDTELKATISKQKKQVNTLVALEGTSILTIAAIHGHVHMFEAITKFVSVDLKNRRGSTALMEALRQEQYASVRELVQDYGANPNTMDNNGISAIMQCCLDADEKGLNTILKYSPNVEINHCNKEGITALMMAANENQMEIAQILLDHGAAINQVDEYGWNCLFYAIHANADGLLVKLLIDYGIDLESRDKEDGWSAIHLATSNAELFKVLLDYLDARIPSRQLAFDIMHQKTRLGSSVLHLAAQGGHKETLRYLIKRQDFDLNEAIKGTGWRPLHFACHQGHLECVKELVESGAQIKVFDEDGSSPFNVAVQVGHANVVKFFLQFQAAKPARNDSSIILEKDIDDEYNILHDTDNDGWTPILWACDKGNISIVKLLVEEDPSVITDRDDDGWTALMIACMEGHLDIVKYLITKGASPSDCDLNGWDCYAFASENNRLDVVKFLSSLKI